MKWNPRIVQYREQTMSKRKLWFSIVDFPLIISTFYHHHLLEAFDYRFSFYISSRDWNRCNSLRGNKCSASYWYILKSIIAFSMFVFRFRKMSELRGVHKNVTLSMPQTWHDDMKFLSSWNWIIQQWKTENN